MLAPLALPVIATILAFVVLAAVVSLKLTPGAAFFASDQGLSMAVAQTMLSGNIPLLGPPSHIGGRHVGPLYYWYQTLLWWLSGQDEFRTIVLDSIVKLGAAIGFVLLTSLYAPKHARGWSAFGASLAVGLGPLISVYRDFWQPHLLLLVGVLHWWAVLRFLKRETSHLGWVLVSGSLCLQAHYAAGIMAATSTLALLLRSDESGVRGWQHSLSCSWSALGAAAACIILWIPTVLYELNYPSNIGALLSALQRPLSPEAQAGLWGSLRNSIAFLSQYALGAPEVTVTQLVTSPWTWLFVLLSTPCLLSLVRGMTGPARFLLWQTLLGLCLYTLLLARQRAPLERYFLFPMIPLIIMSWGIVFGAAFSRIAPGCGLPTFKNRITYGSSLALVFLLLSLSFSNYWRWIDRLRHRPLDRALSLSAAKTIGTSLGASSEPHALVTWGNAHIMEYSYLYFAGPRYWNAMSQGRELKELAVFQEPAEQKIQGTLIACPLPSRERRAQLATRLAARWKISNWASCGDARICGSCAKAQLTSPLSR